MAKLKLLKANHMNNQYRLEDDIARNFPQQIAKLAEIIDSYKADITHFSEHKITDPEQFSMEISGKVFTEKKEAGAALLAVWRLSSAPVPFPAVVLLLPVSPDNFLKDY